jgi:hypothetical protein
VRRERVGSGGSEEERERERETYPSRATQLETLCEDHFWPFVCESVRERSEREVNLIEIQSDCLR